MNIKLIEKLKKEYVNPTFENRNKGKSSSLYYLSFIGNIFLIWWSSKFIIDTLLNFNEFDFKGVGVIITLLSFLFLIFFEFSKRRFIYGFFKELYISKFKFNNQVKESLMFCLFLVGFSSYLAITGSQMLSDKTSQVKDETNLSHKIYSDSINNIYGKKINDINSEIGVLRGNINNSHKKISQINNNTLSENRITSNKENKEINLVKNDILNSEKNISDLETKIQNYNQEKISIIETHNKNLLNVNEEKFKKFDNNVIKSFIWSISCELLVILGLFFNVKFNYNTLLEVTNDEKYKTYTNSLIVLKVLFEDGKLKENDKTMAMSKLPFLCKMVEKTLTDKQITNIIEILKHLSIITTKNKGQGTIILTEYGIAKETLSKHFNF